MLFLLSTRKRAKSNKNCIKRNQGYLREKESNSIAHISCFATTTLCPSYHYYPFFSILWLNANSSKCELKLLLFLPTSSTLGVSTTMCVPLEAICSPNSRSTNQTYYNTICRQSALCFAFIMTYFLRLLHLLLFLGISFCSIYLLREQAALCHIAAHSSSPIELASASINARKPEIRCHFHISISPSCSLSIRFLSSRKLIEITNVPGLAPQLVRE